MIRWKINRLIYSAALIAGISPRADSSDWVFDEYHPRQSSPRELVTVAGMALAVFVPIVCLAAFIESAVYRYFLKRESPTLWQCVLINAVTKPWMVWGFVALASNSNRNPGDLAEATLRQISSIFLLGIPSFIAETFLVRFIVGASFGRSFVSSLVAHIILLSLFISLSVFLLAN